MSVRKLKWTYRGMVTAENGEPGVNGEPFVELSSYEAVLRRAERAEELARSLAAEVERLQLPAGFVVRWPDGSLGKIHNTEQSARRSKVMTGAGMVLPVYLGSPSVGGAPSGWHIEKNVKPIPDRSFDFDYWHDDESGDGALSGNAPSVNAAIGEIAALERDTTTIFSDCVIMPKELTAENGAKFLFTGEFFEEVETLGRKVPVRWDTIKRIYAKAVEHLASPRPTASDELPLLDVEEFSPCTEPCTLGVGCDEAGVCYASAHNDPEQCPNYRGAV